MIAVSDAWKDTQYRFLLPESYVEVTCAITETGVQESATVSGTNEAFFSNLAAVRGVTGSKITAKKYATNELNLWALDGSRNIMPDSEPYENAGYVSNIESTGSVTLTLPEVHSVAIPGVTIRWSSEFEEYPSVFTVTAKNGNTVVAETTVTDNTEQEVLVDLGISDYDSVTVSVLNWGLPHRRARIEYFALGHMLVFSKNDLLSYSHEQSGDLLGGELPKNSVSFSINNIDGRWNPSNPTGLERYLSERQKVTVRYGLDVNGSIEWIKAGTFYLSEWSAPSNGFEAKFVARDVFEFMLGVEMKSATVDTLKGQVEWAARATLPDPSIVVIDSSLANYSTEYKGDGTAAEIVQKCANAAGCVLRYDRDGILHIEPLRKEFADYRITSALAYSHPEVELTKPLKTVEVSYGAETPYELSISSNGEVQTVNNDFITDETQAAFVAAWVRDTLKERKTVRGEYRADPRLDLFDIVIVESKYGALTPVAITDIKYTFNGSFRASFAGRIIDAVSSSTLGAFVLGQGRLGGGV